jgi:hypothetical protein
MRFPQGQQELGTYLSLGMYVQIRKKLNAVIMYIRGTFPRHW